MASHPSQPEVNAMAAFLANPTAANWAEVIRVLIDAMKIKAKEFNK